MRNIVAEVFFIFGINTQFTLEISGVKEIIESERKKIWKILDFDF